MVHFKLYQNNTHMVSTFSKPFGFGLFQKRIGATQPISTATIRLGNTKGRGSSTRIFNYCKEHSFQPSLCINEFIHTSKPLENQLTSSQLYLPKRKIKSYSRVFPQVLPLNQSYFTPLQIRKAYNVPTIPNQPNIRKVRISIIIPYHHPNLLSDLQIVQKKYNLPTPNVQINNLGTSNNTNTYWNQEANLDLQMCYTMNPYAIIQVIESKSDSITDLYSAIQYTCEKGTDIISMSLGCQDTGKFDFLTKNINNKNVCIVAASGDSGFPSWPSTDPNIVSVGATNLQIQTNGNRKSETLWSVSGCGYSPSFVKPSFQNTINANKNRSVPDLCAIGATQSPVVISVNGNPLYLGGTSVSAPIVAGLWSLLIQSRLNNKKNIPLTTFQNNSNAIPIQPHLYKPSNYSSFFYDITQGTSGTTQTGLFSAISKFDIASGLGVMNIKNVLSYFSKL